MVAGPEKLTHNIYDEVGGDASLHHVELRLWAICLSAQRTFRAEVIFTTSQDTDGVKSDEVAKFFVPRDHPRIAELEAYLVKAFRRDLDPSLPELNGWRVDIRVRRYSGVAGARAFRSASDAVFATVRPASVSVDRHIKMAYEAGCKAARSIKHYH